MGDPEIVGAWAGFWGEIAKAFRGNSNVLGAELINEPFVGDVYKDPSILLPGIGDRKKLQSAYDTVAAAIHAADPERLVFFAALPTDDLAAGFDHAPAYLEDTSVLAFHYYAPPQVFGSQNFDFDLRLKDAAKLRTGSMLTEFSYGNATSRAELDEAYQKTVTAAEQRLQSYAWWEMKSFCVETNATLHGESQWAAYGACKTGFGARYLMNADGKVDDANAHQITRTYAYAVAGRTLRQEFTPASAAFVLQYELCDGCQGATEIFASARWQYPGDSMVVAVHPPEAATWTVDGDFITVRAAESVKPGHVITVTIDRKK